MGRRKGAARWRRRRRRTAERSGKRCAPLAPGIYVVTARTATADGATSTEAVRWTRAR